MCLRHFWPLCSVYPNSQKIGTLKLVAGHALLVEPALNLTSPDHLADVYRFLHSGEGCQKAPFSMTEDTVSVWRVGQTGEKKLRFKFIRISVEGPNLRISPRVFSMIIKTEIKTEREINSF